MIMVNQLAKRHFGDQKKILRSKNEDKVFFCIRKFIHKIVQYCSLMSCNLVKFAKFLFKNISASSGEVLSIASVVDDGEEISGFSGLNNFVNMVNFSMSWLFLLFNALLALLSLHLDLGTFSALDQDCLDGFGFFGGVKSANNFSVGFLLDRIR